MYDGAPPFKCERCPKGDRKRRSCTEISKTPVIKVMNKFEFYTCPVNHIEPVHADMLSIYTSYKSGFLFCDGGIGDQPAMYVDAMLTLHVFFTNHEAEQMKKKMPSSSQKIPIRGRTNG